MIQMCQRPPLRSVFRSSPLVGVEAYITKPSSCTTKSFSQYPTHQIHEWNRPCRWSWRCIRYVFLASPKERKWNWKWKHQSRRGVQYTFMFKAFIDFLKRFTCAEVLYVYNRCLFRAGQKAKGRLAGLAFEVFLFLLFLQKVVIWFHCLVGRSGLNAPPGERRRKENEFIELQQNFLCETSWPLAG